MTTAVKPAIAEIVGFVEAFTVSAILGWAWAPAAPNARVRVELILDGAIVAAVDADREREDLVRNGVGDGAHAFEITVPDTIQSRRPDLRVYAKLDEGPAVALGAAPVAKGVGERLDRIQRTLEILINSQRLIQRNLQAALTAERPPEPKFERTQIELSEQIASVELFAMRLDARLQKLTEVLEARPPQRSWPILAAAAVAFLVLLGSAMGLLQTVRN